MIASETAVKGWFVGNWVDEYLEAVKQRLGLSSDAELASELGFGKSTFATWRRRGAIPDPALTRLAAHVGHDLTTGDEVLFAVAVTQADTLMRALFTYIVLLHRKAVALQFEDQDEQDMLFWAGMRFEIERYLRPIIRERTAVNFRMLEVWNELKAGVDRGEIASPDTIMDLWHARNALAEMS